MNKEVILKVIESGMDLSHFLILRLIATDQDIEELWKNTKLRSYREALIRKGYITEISNRYFLTEQGAEVFDKCTTEEVIQIEPIKTSFKQAAGDILLSVKSLLKEKTGSTRLILKTGSFLPSERELSERLEDFSRLFNNIDFDKIKKAILDYTNDIILDKISFPRKMKYFLFKKDKESHTIISDIQMYLETLEEETEKEHVDTRNLF